MAYEPNIEINIGNELLNQIKLYTIGVFRYFSQSQDEKNTIVSYNTLKET